MYFLYLKKCSFSGLSKCSQCQLRWNLLPEESSIIEKGLLYQVDSNKCTSLVWMESIYFTPKPLYTLPSQHWVHSSKLLILSPKSSFFISHFVVYFRVLSIDSHNIEALKYRTLYALCRQGNFEDAAQGLRNLYTEMDRSEPNNASLFVHMAQLFSRLVGIYTWLYHFLKENCKKIRSRSTIT